MSLARYRLQGQPQQKIRPEHLDRAAMVYVRQSTRQQVLEHSDNNMISLEKELHTLNLYMQLESLRLNMDLKYSLETNEVAHEIVITEPIKLGKKVVEAPYVPPAGATPQPTSLPTKLADPSPSPAANPTSTPKT